MVGIVIALQSEAKKLLEDVSDLQQIELLDKKAYSCKINGIDAVIAISGIGKVSASITAQAIIDKYSPDYIINAGTCGGTDFSVSPLNFYLVDKCFQFDFDVTQIDDVEIGYIQEYNTKFFNAYTKGLDFLEKANLATADRFSNHPKDLSLIYDCGCAIRDMEGCAIAQTCTSNNIPFIAIKGVSDVYGSGVAKEQFFANLGTVCNMLSPVVIQTINTLYNK